MPYGTSVYGTGTYEAPTYNQAVDALPAPQYHWKLGEAAGSTTVVDRKGNYPVALTVDPGATLGTPGLLTNNASDTAVTLDGTTSGDIFGASASRPTITATTFAWSVWFKVDATNALTGIQYICSLTGSGTDHSGICLNGNKIEGFFQSGVTYVTADSTTSVVAGGTYRASCSYDGTNLVTRINGVTQTTTPSTSVPNTGIGFSAVIGSDWALTQRFKGVVDEAAFYAQPLPAAKDLAEYTAGASAAPVTVTSTAAAASASSVAPVDKQTAVAGAASATASTTTVTDAVTAATPPAAATASAAAPTISTAANPVVVVAPAATAAASAQAPIARTSATSPAGASTAASAAPVVTGRSTVPAGSATSSSVAPLPRPSVPAPAATASAAPAAPTAHVVATGPILGDLLSTTQLLTTTQLLGSGNGLAAVATANTSSPNAVQGVAPVVVLSSAAPATASASAPSTTTRETVVPVTASASSTGPVAKQTAVSPAAGGTASAGGPVARLAKIVPAATTSASVSPAVLRVLVAAAAGSATANNTTPVGFSPPTRVWYLTEQADARAALQPHAVRAVVVVHAVGATLTPHVERATITIHSTRATVTTHSIRAAIAPHSTGVT